MPFSDPACPLPEIDDAALRSLMQAAGPGVWRRRVAELAGWARGGQRSGRALLQRHAIELTVERLVRGMDRAPTHGERLIAAIAAAAGQLHQTLPAEGQARFTAMLAEGLSGVNTLVPLFHIVRTALLQRQRGFDVHFSGFAEGTTFDLLLTRDGAEAEVACDIVSAEDGRDLHRGAWFNLVDRVDPDLQTWLAAHPGRYLLKLTLPQGLRGEQATLSALHERIRDMLAGARRSDQDAAAVLRLDPLMLAAAQADELGIVDGLRREFGAEAHLAVTASGGGLFVMAARAGRGNEVAAAIRRRLFAIAPMRLSGTRPGILAMFVEDTDRTEWRSLRDTLELEGETRQFLAQQAARGVVAVTCASRLELLGATAPDAAEDGELRFRNPAHPAAKTAALAPAISSSI